MLLRDKLRFSISGAVAMAGLVSAFATQPIVETFYPKPTEQQQEYYKVIDQTLENRLNIDYYVARIKEKESQQKKLEDTLENEPQICTLEDEINYFKKRWGLAYLRGLKNQHNLKVDSPGLEYATDKIYAKFEFSFLSLLAWSLGTVYLSLAYTPIDKEREPSKEQPVKKTKIPPFLINGSKRIGNGIDKMWDGINLVVDHLDQRKLYPIYKKTRMDKWFFTSMPDDYKTNTNQ